MSDFLVEFRLGLFCDFLCFCSEKDLGYGCEDKKYNASLSRAVGLGDGPRRRETVRRLS